MAQPTDNQLLEKAPGGLPLVQAQGLATKKAVNFSGFTINTSGVASGVVTGPTGSFAALQITSANASGATGVTAALGPVGALDGGPTTTAQNGWAVLYVAGVKCWVPVWV